MSPCTAVFLGSLSEGFTTAQGMRISVDERLIVNDEFGRRWIIVYK
jgi:hypothetical protein